jgi:hypothetical protein
MRWRGRGGQRFLLSLPRRHPLLLIEQVRNAHQAEGSLVAGHPLQLMIFIMGSVGLPLVIAGGGRQLGWLPEKAAPFLSQIDNPEAARQRLVWALRGLRIKKEKRHETTHRHPGPAAGRFGGDLWLQSHPQGEAA